MAGPGSPPCFSKGIQIGGGKSGVGVGGGRGEAGGGAPGQGCSCVVTSDLLSPEMLASPQKEGQWELYPQEDSESHRGLVVSIERAQIQQEGQLCKQ